MFKYTHAWLYVRATESIRVVEIGATELMVCGPGGGQERVRFERADQAREFRKRQVDAFVAAGYRFLGFPGERRRGADRRTSARGGRDRRRPDTSIPKP